MLHRSSSLVLLITLLCSSLLLPETLGSAVSVPPVTAPPSAAAVAESSNTNPVGALFGYVKDSVVRTIDGCGQMWRNHERCNRIRSKQREHKEQLQRKWEMEGQMSPEEVKQKLKTVQGGITYDEFSFLIKGKMDRGKLMQLGFLMWGAPKFLPYMLMMNPDMLPSPFVPAPNAALTKESVLEKLSRERSHAVIQTLINMENQAKKVPALAKLNIFGKKAQERQLENMQMMGEMTARIMMAPGAQGSNGAHMFLNSLNQYLYRSTEFSKGENRLVDAPKAVLKGVILAVEGPNPLSHFLPNFMTRGKVIAHIQKITTADDFLVQENIDLATLDTTHLVEACGERFIGGIGRTDDELRESLGEWLDLVVNQPEAKVQQSGQFYNANMGRLSLLCYNALDATRDPRSASYLPRLLFQGQLQDSPGLLIENGGSSDDEMGGKAKKNK